MDVAAFGMLRGAATSWLLGEVLAICIWLIRSSDALQEQVA